MTGEWKRLYSEEPNGTHSSPCIIRGINPRIRWAGYVTHIEKSKGEYRDLVAKHQMDHLEDLGLDGRII
jgi:hypothetical protein